MNKAYSMARVCCVYKQTVFKIASAEREAHSSVLIVHFTISLYSLHPQCRICAIKLIEIISIIMCFINIL